jgi:hypothetical protein
MATMRNSLLSRVAVQSMTWAVRVWPESSREWGMAVLGEMGEITEPGAALSWAAGGMLLFLRAMLAQFLQWMKLPVGSGFSGAVLPSPGNGPQFPNHSRLATAVVLLASVTLLFLPMGREAAGTVEASWHGFLPSQEDRRELERVAARAEKEKDARTLAFVALTHPDADRGAHFADQAVTLDPSLTWIYASRYSYRGHGTPMVSAERLKELKKYDPDNAEVYLISAFVAGELVIENAVSKKSTGWEPSRDKLARNGEWMKDMEAAFRAPKYDNYFERHQELAREGWKKAPGISPGVIAIGLWAHGIPNMLQIQTYAEIRVKEALETGAAGNIQDAESTLAEVTGLGQRISGAGTIPFERVVGLGLMKRGMEGYEKLYRASGRTKEADEVREQLSEVESSMEARIHSYIGWREGIVQGLRWKAVLFQGAAMLSLLLAMAIGLSLVVIETSAAIGRKGSGWLRRAICEFIDYGPVALLVTSAIFLWSFRPIAAVFEQYRSGELKQGEALGFFWEFFTLGTLSPAPYFSEPYHEWLLATIVLVGLGVFVVVRGLLRPRAHESGR